MMVCLVEARARHCIYVSGEVRPPGQSRNSSDNAKACPSTVLAHRQADSDIELGWVWHIEERAGMPFTWEVDVWWWDFALHGFLQGSVATQRGIEAPQHGRCVKFRTRLVSELGPNACM